MMPELLVKEAQSQGAQFLFAPDGALYSMTPPETLFGFTYHSSMVPPYKPEHTLLLGYGFGTVAELIRKIWGQVKVTGVDIEAHDYAYTEYKIKNQDAREFMNDCTGIFKTTFDYIAIDLWEGKKVPEFVFEKDFATKLKMMAKKMVSINLAQPNMESIFESFTEAGFVFERGVPIEGNAVMWWSV